MSDIVLSRKLQIAESIAKAAHMGQKYGGDKDYFEAHVMKVFERVRDAGYNEDVQCVAMLHDVVEDSDYTLQDIYEIGMCPTVVSAVGAMTHREEESYMEYLFRAARNRIARIVKYHDMLENLSNNPNSKQVVKYTMGLDYIRLEYGEQ